MLFYVMSCYVILFDFMLCHVISCHAMLVYVMLCCGMLRYFMLCYAMACYCILCCVAAGGAKYVPAGDAKYVPAGDAKYVTAGDAEYVPAGWLCCVMLFYCMLSIFKSRDFKSKSRDFKSCDFKSPASWDLRFEKYWLQATKHIYRCKAQWCGLQRMYFCGIRTRMTFPQLFRSRPYVFSMAYVLFITYVMCSSFGAIFTADLKFQILVACDLKSQFVFADICNGWDTCGDYVLYFGCT